MTYHLPPIESWSDWTAAYNDVSLWRPIVDAICNSEGIRYQSIEAPRSNTNAVFILDRRLVVKIYSPFWSEFDIERDVFISRQFGIWIDESRLGSAILGGNRIQRTGEFRR